MLRVPSHRPMLPVAHGARHCPALGLPRRNRQLPHAGGQAAAVRTEGATSSSGPGTGKDSSVDGQYDRPHRPAGDEPNRRHQRNSRTAYVVLSVRHDRTAPGSWWSWTTEGWRHRAVRSVLAHGFVIASPQARFLTLHTPGGGFDELVAETGVPLLDGEPTQVGHGPDPEELTRISASHGIRIMGPPLLP